MEIFNDFERLNTIVSGVSDTVNIANTVDVSASLSLPVSGSFQVSFPPVQEVSGIVTLSNPQTVVGISGVPTISVTNLPDIQNSYILNQIGISGTPLVTISNPTSVVGVSSIPNVTISNFPQIQSISASSIIPVSGTVGITALSSIPTIVSNSISVSALPSITIGNFPSIQNISHNGIAQPISGTIAVSNPIYTVGISSIPNVTISNPQTIVGISGTPSVIISNPATVVGVSSIPNVTISNFPQTQGISASSLSTYVSNAISISAIPSISVGNFPSIQNISFNGSAQPISGAVSISNQITTIGVSSLPDITVGISGNPTISISNFPETQSISGDVNATINNTLDISASSQLPIINEMPVINYWPAMVGIAPATDTSYIDPSGALQVRGAITSDEGSYSTDFNEGVYYNLTGVLSFVNGSYKIYGSGTKFLSELGFGDYVKYYLDSELYQTPVSNIDSDTELTLSLPYLGTSVSGTGVGSGFEYVTGSGTISASNSYLILDSGVTSGSFTQASRDVDFLPTAVILRNFYVTQNIDNNDSFFGFFDTEDYRTFNVGAYILFNGASYNSGVLITRTSNSLFSTNIVPFTLPGTNSIQSPAKWKLEITDEKVTVFYNDLKLAESSNHLPPIYKPLSFVLGTFNTNVPASTTKVYVDELLFKNVDVVNTASVLQTHVQYSSDTTAQEYLKELASIVEILVPAVRAMTNNVAMAIDINGRQRTNIEAGTVTANCNINASQTLTTVSTLANQSSIGSYSANDQVPAIMNNNAMLLRTGIIVS